MSYLESMFGGYDSPSSLKKERDDKMRIAFDLHGVIDKYLDLYKQFMKHLKSKNVEIYIVSGPPMQQLAKELEVLELVQGVHYDRMISVVDFLKEYFPEVKWRQDYKGNWWTNEDDWWASKDLICREYKIDILFDDSPGYGEYFEDIKDPKFVLLRE